MRQSWWILAKPSVRICEQVRLAVGLEYDGACFCGWQSQPCGGGGQDAAQQAFAVLAGKNTAVHAAGRTDAGVHASLQIAHLDVDIWRQASAWTFGANAYLPKGMRVLWTRPVAADFHARYMARRRTYQYVILNRPIGSAIVGGALAHHRTPLSLSAMQEAAAQLIGEHDFSAFRAASCQAKHARRHLFAARVSRHGDLIIMDFCANGFLHHMVRNMVGALLQVGRGRRPPSWLGELLQGGDRSLAAPTAPAAGLYFVGAEYPRRFEIAEYYRPPPFLLAMP